MRSKISKKILSETSQETKDKVNDYANKLVLSGVSKSKADEREQAYQKFFYDHPNFRGKSIRYRGNYIFHKDEAYDCIDYYLRTGIEP